MHYYGLTTRQSHYIIYYYFITIIIVQYYELGVSEHCRLPRDMIKKFPEPKSSRGARIQSSAAVIRRSRYIITPPHTLAGKYSLSLSLSLSPPFKANLSRWGAPVLSAPNHPPYTTHADRVSQHNPHSALTHTQTSVDLSANTYDDRHTLPDTRTIPTRCKWCLLWIIYAILCISTVIISTRGYVVTIAGR